MSFLVDAFIFVVLQNNKLLVQTAASCAISRGIIIVLQDLIFVRRL